MPKRFLLVLSLSVLLVGILMIPTGAVVPPWLQANTDDNTDNSGTGSTTSPVVDIPTGEETPYYMYYGITDYEIWESNIYMIGYRHPVSELRQIIGCGFGYMGTTGAGQITSFNSVNFCSQGSFKKFRNYGYLLTCFDDAAYSQTFESSTVSVTGYLSRYRLCVSWVDCDEDGKMVVYLEVYDNNWEWVDVTAEDVEQMKSNPLGRWGIKWFSGGNPISELSFDEDTQQIKISCKNLPVPYALGQFFFCFSPCDHGSFIGGTDIRGLETDWRFVWSYGGGYNDIYVDHESLLSGLNANLIVCDVIKDYGLLSFVILFCFLCFRVIIDLLKLGVENE